MKRLALLAAALLLAPPTTAFAAKISWETAVQSVEGSIEPATAQPGQTVTFKLSIRLHPGHWTYPTVQSNPKEAETRNVFVLPTTDDLIFVEPIRDPADAHTKPSPAGGDMSYYPDGATWEFKAVVSPKATPGPLQAKVQVKQLLICNDDACIPPGSVKLKEVQANLTVAGAAVPVESQFQAIVADRLNPRPKPKDVEPPTPHLPPEVKGPPREPKVGPTPVAVAPGPQGPSPVARRLSADQDHAADLTAVLDQLPPNRDGPRANGERTGLGGFIATAAFWGLITLLTPCVFPMVPITVSIFLKQSEKQGTNVLALALVYAVTIVVLLSVAAMTLLTTFSRLAVDPITNVLLGALFVVLALSLFGLFEITLPSSVATALDNRAARGGYAGTVFMAASFTVVSFTCVAPFLGGFSGMAASGNFSTLELAAGAIAFATAFASPFFLLALFPSLIKKLPKSGDWMNMVKVSMGFLELAAALKFFRTAELRWLTPTEYFTYDFVLALWVAILMAMALYLFGVFRTRHDHEAHDHVGPWRIIFALSALGLGVYLMPALFGAGPKDRNRPAGIVYAWVDSFLLPEPVEDLPWSADLRRTLDDARANNGRVFVDFTGITCTNCKLNEMNVFTKAEVRGVLQQYSLVQMYTDTIPETFYEADPGRSVRNEHATANLDFEKKAFGEEQLPLYVILKPEPNGKTRVLGIYNEGKINNEAAFVAFLKSGLK